jgi:hypothetical protein
VRGILCADIDPLVVVAAEVADIVALHMRSIAPDVSCAESLGKMLSKSEYAIYTAK